MPVTVTQESDVMEKLRATAEAAAIAAAPWVGQGNKYALDGAAVRAMEAEMMGNMAFTGVVVMGEGVKDKAPMLPHGARLGINPLRVFDIAVDPAENTTAASEGRPGAVSVIALAPRGAMVGWNGVNYMNKLVVGPEAAQLIAKGEIGLHEPPYQNIDRLAKHLGKKGPELTVAVLDRPRNKSIMGAARAMGVNLKLLNGGDVLPAIQTATDHGKPIDLLYGSGGAPEAILTAAAIGALGGNMQASWFPETIADRMRLRDREELDKVFDMNELVGDGELHFVMTAITDYQNWLTGCQRDDDGQWQAGTTVEFTRPAS